MVTQIGNQLKTRELVKVKIQKSALGEVGTSGFAKKIAESTGSTLVEIIGHTFTLYKRREPRVVQGKAENVNKKQRLS